MVNGTILSLFLFTMHAEEVNETRTVCSWDAKAAAATQ
jgi:hypothetical protein